MAFLRVVIPAVAAVLLTGCVMEEDDTGDSDSGSPQYPAVIDATAKATGDTYTFTVTISSPYDSPQRYANGWRIMDDDGNVYAKHTLRHHHASDQPFTRTQTGVRIPDRVDEVVVEGRDLLNGYGGATQRVTLP